MKVDDSNTQTNTEDGGVARRVAALIASLASAEAGERRAAREALEAVGPAAVGPLVRELGGLDEQAREEAVRALGRIGGSEAVPVLIRELEDEESRCRWLAAEALASIGEPALVPLLELLAQGVGTVHLRRGIHHVLHTLEKWHPRLLAPVLAAFQSDVPEIAIPGTACAALMALNS